MIRFIPDWLRNRRVTRWIRLVMDEGLPPFVREFRPINQLMGALFFGEGFDLDFKEKAFSLSNSDLAAAYSRLSAGKWRYRDSDTTAEQAEQIATNCHGPRVLEVGCGMGMVSEVLIKHGFHVTASDITSASVLATRDRTGASSPLHVVAAALPLLPFSDRAFDTVVCSHTLEHIPRVWAAAQELERVAARRLVIVVPRQRYYRYTIDLHLHFFRSAAPLQALFNLEPRVTKTVDGDWLYVGERSTLER